MLSFNKSEKKLPNVKIISNKGQLLNTINENFQHILTDIYDKDIVPPQNDIYITLQFILITISAIAFYINTKCNFDQYKHIQWILTSLFFLINISCYLYDNIVYYKNNKSKPLCRNLSNNMVYCTKIEYKDNKDKWPEYYLINNQTKLYLRDFIDNDYKSIDYEKFKKLIQRDLVNKKHN
ncbi:uncharacterized protein HGUI_01988 [Hanseniaspora guilliermondii]|uniref:Uncharacterized protein n=1 Tax=Hanseniaspora guilliermondii TaxID=56406 RepID=A0A1L0B1V0_9ASCO|nr:uncharacterized protein HGUI_01988 [Hanseniaspora guilliermondii]